MIVVVPVRADWTPDGADSPSPAQYRASMTDVVAAAMASGGEVLVNHRPGTASEDAEDLVRTELEAHLEDSDAIRFEPQVGSTRSARIGNTVTHLLEEEGATSVGVVDPIAPLVRRTDIDGAAMALRRTDVLLAPSLSGGCYLAGFTDSIDFTDVYEGHPLEQLTERALAADLTVDTAAVSPTIDSAVGRATVTSIVAARQRAGRAVPERYAATLED